jgi:hypothetical protein
MNTPPPSTTPLLHEYRKHTEAGAADEARGWQEMQRRLFPPPGGRNRRAGLLVGSLATALAAAWLLGAAPRPARPSASGASGSGGSEGTSGRGWAGGGSPGRGAI